MNAGRVTHDEHSVSETWLRHLHPRHLHPRRGGTPAPVFPTRPAPSKWLSHLIEEERTRLDEVLNHPQSDGALVRAAREYLNGANTPTGAAAVAATVIGSDDEPALLDAWTTRGGATFAACAFAEFHTLGATWNEDRLFFQGKGERGFLSQASARHLRSILAALPQTEYRHTINQLAAHRRTEFQRLVVAYLAPDQTEWADEACSGPPDPDLQWIVMCVASSAGHLGSIGDKIAPPHCELGLLATMAEGLGPLAAPVMIRTVEGGALAKQREALFEVLGALPSDESMAHLIRRLDARPTLLAAMKRFPERAIRVLAERLGPSELLDSQVRAFPEVAAASLPHLEPTTRAVVEAVSRGSLRLPEAADDILPPSLVNPPWTRKKPKEKPFVLTLSTPNERAISWEPGELEFWKNSTEGYAPHWYHADCKRAGNLRQAPPTATEDDPIWAARVEDFRVGDLDESEQVTVLAHGPVRRARPLLRGWFPEDWRSSITSRHPEKWMRILVARYELDALAVILRFARGKPVRFGHLLLPYLDAEVAALMADWSSRSTGARELAEIWFGRHGHGAVPLLIPAALGKPGTQRRNAAWALHQIATEHGSEAVVEAAAVHGDDARAAIAALLERDPDDLLPRKIPDVPERTAPFRLPQILLRDRERALPEKVTWHFLTMLLMSTLSKPHPGVDQVKAVCDPESLTAFAWELFQQGDDLGFVALGLLGDDDSARRIGPLISAWPGDGHHAKAVKGLDVLATIGSEVALAELDAISRKAKFKALKARAQEKLAEVAERLGLSAEQLADRLVPDLGLDAEGGLVLDYGPRRFTVGFDEQLRPFVADEDGTRRKTLPKPGVRDDATLAPRAYERFTQLKKDVRKLASGQVARLELAMVLGRQWSPREFEALFVRHPLMWHIARRLVWTSGGTAFRLAEDRTCADVHDDVLEPGEAIALAHPLDLGTDLESWTRVFADYELLQPFKQLGRAVHTLTDEERATGHLKRFEGTATTAYKVWGLERRGWERGVPQDNGIEVWISRPLPDGRHIVANLNPGIIIDDPFAWPDVTITHVWVAEQPQRFQNIHVQPFDTVPPTIISEVIADLTHLLDS